MPPIPPSSAAGHGVSEALQEFQGYVLAYRLRSELGGRLTPREGRLTLAEYAGRRLRRQELARGLIRSGLAPERMRELDRLSDELMFGFWLNPAEVAAFLRVAIRQGSHPALDEPAAFSALLTHAERLRLGEDGVERVCTHYLTCLTLAAPMLDPDGLAAVWQRIEATTPPLFVDELTAPGSLP